MAAFDGVSAVKSLTATFRMKPERSGTVHVSGIVEGVVTQTCIVSLDPFDAAIEEPVDLVFMPEHGMEAWLTKFKDKRSEDATLEDEDPPDPIVDGKIDLGQLMAEFLALGIDPYPRRPGVAFDAAPYTADEEPSPFAALARFKEEG